MEVRFLGAHQLETSTTRLSAVLIDGWLALDAGSISRSLTLKEQMRLTAIALTHWHYDHIRDLPTFGLATEEGPATEVIGLAETLEAIDNHLQSGPLYPDFARERPHPEAPKYRMRPIRPNQPINLGGYTLEAFPVPHGPPAVAYRLAGEEGRALLFGGDTCPGVRRIWPMFEGADLLVLESTFPDRLGREEALRSHLTPAAMGEELEAYREVHGTLPRVAATHLNPWYEEEIRRDLKAMAERVGVDLTIATEDLVVEV